jgi:shikimate dehydrogenase
VTPRLTSATRLIALLGDPVSHSLSPVFQNAALDAAGLDGVYVALRCGAPELPGLLRGIALGGGAGNVTLPHKALAAESVDRATPAVRRTGACNTYWLEDGVVWGDNTDVEGVASAVRGLLGREVSGARVLLLGAGGSARAALAAMVEGGASEVVVANRTVQRASLLAAGFAGGETPVRAAAPDSLRGERFDLAINATSLGLRATDALPLEMDDGQGIGAALDLVYSRKGTPWVHALQARGIPAMDGLEMLILQGAASFERWWKTPAPVERMREALARLADPVA